MMRNETLTWERLNYVLDINSELGTAYWKNPPGNKADVLRGTIAGHHNHRFKYVVISIDKKAYKRHRLIWFHFHKCWPANDLDHENGDRIDDRICNLREATRSQNMWNTKATKRSSTGRKGVYKGKTANTWRVAINVNMKNIYIGTFDSFDAAVGARVAAEARYHGQFSRQS